MAAVSLPSVAATAAAWGSTCRFQSKLRLRSIWAHKQCQATTWQDLLCALSRLSIVYDPPVRTVCGWVGLLCSQVDYRARTTISPDAKRGVILAEIIGDNPCRSGDRQILRVAEPTDLLVRINKRRGKPY